MSKFPTIIRCFYAALAMAISFPCAAGEVGEGAMAKAVSDEMVRAEIHVGKVLFKRKCGRCHSATEPVNEIGPTLYRVVGRRAATAPGYDFSASLRTSGLVWTEENLTRYINDPRALVPCQPIRIRALSMCPGIHMKFRGFKNIHAAKAVVAYLQSIK